MQQDDYRQFIKIREGQKLMDFSGNLSAKGTLLHWIKSAVQATQQQGRPVLSVIFKSSHTPTAQRAWEIFPSGISVWESVGLS